jgi:hypothetical protein
MEVKKIEPISKTNNGNREKDKPKPPKKKGNQVNTKSFKQFMEELK